MYIVYSMSFLPNITDDDAVQYKSTLKYDVD